MPWRRIASRPLTSPSPQQRRAGHAEQHRQLGRQAPDLGRVGGRVAGNAEEHGVPERQQAAESDEQVEGAREQREAHDLHEVDRVHEQRREREERDHQREGQGLAVARQERGLGHGGSL
jgi:hypothetical protein